MAEGHAEDAATVELLWGERRVATRGPKRSMSLDQIADAALAVADAEGIEGASMQRVADDLGVTKMSLYRYVAGKSELVALTPLSRRAGCPLSARTRRSPRTRTAPRRR